MSRKIMRPLNIGKPSVPVFASREAPSMTDVKAVVDQTATAFADFRKENGDRVGSLEAEMKELNSRIALSDRHSPTGMLGIGEQKEREQFAAYLRNPIKAAMSVDSNPDGGYLVPRTIDQQIATIARDNGTMRKLATVVTLQPAGSSYVKVVNIGGVQSGWVSEKQTRAETNASVLSELEYPVHEVYAMPKVTQKLLDDASVNVAELVANDIALEFAIQENAAFVTGDGIKKPRGFLDYDVVANASWAWGKIGWIKSGVAAALFDGSNNGVDALIDLTHSLKTEYMANASFVMNRATAAVVRKLKDENGQYLWQSSVQAGQPNTLLGYPVYIDPNMDDIGAGTFPIAFGDFRRGYVIVDRIGIRVVPDQYSSRPYVLFYTTKRVGGGVQDFQAIKLMKIAA